MKLNAPKQIVWIIALILGLLGVLFEVITVPFFSSISFLFVVIAWVLLILSTYL